MTTTFHTLDPEVSIAQAIRLFKSVGEKENRRIFGMMVTDDDELLVGIISMYDILLFVRPKHIHVWGSMEDIDVAGLMESVCESAKSVRVGDIMSTDVITITPDTHLMVVLDIMTKKHIRRIPVVSGGRIEGIVYISDLFGYIGEKLAP
ncbi:MAG: CBS domain-containing protein [Desulfomonile tiedjei]|nr:CBS domain-containing protein [Desulfomonile tiedjei]